MRKLSPLIFFILLLAACGPGTALPPAPASPAAFDWYTVYFSDPAGPDAGSLRGGPDADLAASIDAARLSVDAALYDLNLWSIRDALLAAHRRGVTVRLVVESSHLDREEFTALKDAGIVILGDRREPLMHNKFVVIDRYEVWTGSMNLTLNGVYRNNNNLLRLRSSRLGENYTAEFEEMFVDDAFGAGSPANTPYPKLAIDGTPVETYFSPEDNVENRIVQLIDEAQTSIHLLAFSLTADRVGEALLQAYRRGVAVSGVIETGQASNQGTEFFRLVDAGLDIILDGNPKNMHHKVMIIDSHIVIVGSYNFSRAAKESNDENSLILFNSEIASLFLEEFDKIYAVGQ